jgi:channel protein (hemolysin III family)
MHPFALLGFNDPVSSMSHLFVGVPLFLVLTVVMLRRGRGDAGRQFALGLYGLTNVFLFAMSGVYHLLPSESAGRLVLQRLDHAAIFCLIAGTFTPAHYILFRGWQRWVPLSLIWAAAILGVMLKTVYFHELSEALGLSLYLGMGWIGGLSGFFIWYRYGSRLFVLLLGGALSYTIGAVIDFLRWPILIPGVLGHHECFHIAVILGAGWFCYFMYLIAPGDYLRVVRAAARLDSELYGGDEGISPPPDPSRLA